MNSTYVYLVGGLGNQLFQLAAAVSLEQKLSGNVLLDSGLGNPRMSDNKADIDHLNLPPNVSVLYKKASLLSKKSAGFLLRMGILPTKLERKRTYNLVLRKLGEKVLSLRYRNHIHAQIANNVGFTLLETYPNPLLIGYFQSFKFSSNPKVYELMFDLSPKIISEKLVGLIDQAKLQQPIFIHVRLKDYLQEKHFGIPETSYYYRGLSSLNGENRNIWIFSDDILLARSKMPIEFKGQYTYVDDSDLTPAQLLHLLRYGKDYVIANSTLSWWGAFLTMNKDSRVIAPDPWFAGMPEPLHLIPPTWERERAQQ